MPLPATRKGTTHKVRLGDFAFFITCNFREGSTLVEEVFVTASKPGTIMKGLLSALALTISVALQHGTEWDVLSEKYKGHRFEPSTPECPSLLHLIAETVDDAIVHREKLLLLLQEDIETF